MYKFAFLLKTYEKDYKYAKRLLESYAKYNRDNIPCFIVLPQESKEQFMESLDESVMRDIIFLAEEECGHLTEEAVGGLSAGYINQEIVKLSFWEKGLCRNYCCLDSDGVFIRDFYFDDFMYDENTPYSVLIQDNGLKADPGYYYAFWIEREKALLKIQDELDFKDKKLMTCHGFQNFSCTVLENFKNKFMEPKNYDYIDLMRIAPYEFTWYNIWLQKSRIIDVHPCDEIFKYFHMEYLLFSAHLHNIQKKDLARSYIGIVINSNFSKGKLINYEDWKIYFESCIWAIKQIIKGLLARALKFINCQRGNK